MASELQVNTITEATSGSGITFAKDVIPTTPLSHRNLIINGAFNIWQRSTDITASDGSNEGYNSVDRWYFNFNSACPGTLDIDRSTDTPDDFGYSMKLKCNATGTPVGSSADFVTANMRIEAQDLQHLSYGSSGAKVTTLSWYMKSVNYTDPITVSIQKPDGTAAYYLKSFTPTTSWARYTMTIPANTTSGHTIANDNGVGFVVQIALSGSDGGSFEQTGASSSWGTTYKEYINDIGNFFASTSNELYITGMQLELGSVATPFEHRSYGEELRRCERYFQRPEFRQGFFGGSGQIRGNTGTCFISYAFPVRMRATPGTITLPTIGQSNGQITFLNGEAYPNPHGSLATTNTTPDHCCFFFESFNNGLGTAHTNCWAYVTNNSGNNNAFFEFDAEL